MRRNPRRVRNGFPKSSTTVFRAAVRCISSPHSAPVLSGPCRNICASMRFLRLGQGVVRASPPRSKRGEFKPPYSQSISHSLSPSSRILAASKSLCPITISTGRRRVRADPARASIAVRALVMARAVGTQSRGVVCGSPETARTPAPVVSGASARSRCSLCDQ